VIGADHLAQFFGIEPRRQRRRADQVAEHHRQLPALGRRAGGGCGDVMGGGGPGAQAGDRFEEHAAVADHADAEILEVLGGQLRQHPHVDAVVVEGGRILLEAQRPQPLRNIHRRLPRQRIAG
jgi:hypothetical protein